MLFKRKITSPLTLYVDGGTGDRREAAGAAAIATDGAGHFIGWLSRQLPVMTNNEAEYQAALLGLELAQQLGAQQVEIISDSTTVVRQMQGRSRIHSKGLQVLHKQTCAQVRLFKEVTFRHVLRTENTLADALASLARQGTPVQMKPSRARSSLIRSTRKQLGRLTLLRRK